MREFFRHSWRLIKSIYYASATSWRLLKAGSLVFLGFFCWSASNLMVSYGVDGLFWYLLMAYGFLLIFFGPLTHLVLLPYALPWLRRRRRDSFLHTLGKNLSPTTLTVFFLLVTVMGVTRADIMTFDFSPSSYSRPPVADINPELRCNYLDNKEVIECRLTSDSGIASLVLESGNQELLVDNEPPFSFVIAEDGLEEVVGQRQLRVILRDDQRNTVRQFTRTVRMIE
jgi:hypothetical protein